MGRINPRIVILAAAAIIVVGALVIRTSGRGHTTSAAQPPVSATAELATPSAPAAPSTAPLAPARFPPPFQSVPTDDPIAVLTAVCRTLFSYEPSDSTPADAAHRAAPLIAEPVDDSYAALPPITGAQWRRWTNAGDRVIAQVQVPSRNDNPDTSTAVTRVVTVTDRVDDAAGHPTGETVRFTAYATVSKGDNGIWRLEKVTVQ